MNPAREVDRSALPPQIAAQLAQLERDHGEATAIFHGRIGALTDLGGPPVGVHGHDPRDLGYLVVAGSARVLYDARSGARVATALAPEAGGP